MNPKTVKDSDSFIASNKFEEFNNTLSGESATVDKGKRLPVNKKDSQTMGKTPSPEGNVFENFNNTLKKKEVTGDSGAGELDPVVSPEASTSTSTSVGDYSKAVDNYTNATSFIKSDVANQVNQGKSFFPVTVGAGSAPVPANAMPGNPSMLDNPLMADDRSKAPDEVRIMNNPDDFRTYMDKRTRQIKDDIKALDKARKAEIVTTDNRGDLDLGGLNRKNSFYYKDKAKYDKIGGEINNLTNYLKDLQSHATTVVSDLLVKRQLEKYPEGQKILTGTIDGQDVNIGMIGSPKELGRDIVRYADQQSNDQFTALEQSKGDLGPIVSADLEAIGLKAWKDYLLAHEELPNREKYIEDLASWAGDYDIRNYELTGARVKHKIGAVLQQDSGFGSSIFRRAPSEAMLVEAAKKANLTPSEMQVFNKYVLPQERENIGTDIPMSGFINKFGEAVASNVQSLGGTFLNSDSDRLYESLNQEANTRFDEVGEFARDKAELLALEKKSKTKEGITADEKTRMNELKNYNDVRRWYDKFWDGAGDLTGQVAYQAGLARLFGGIGNTAAKAPVVGGLISRGTTILGGPDAINLMVTSFLTSYDNHAKEAVTLMPREDQKLERRLYAYTMASVEGLSERIFPDTKVLDAFKKQVAPDVVKLAKRLGASEITEEAAKTRLQSIIANKLKPFAKEFVKGEIQEGTEEAVVDVAQGIADTVFAGKDFDAEQTFGNAANTFLTTMAYSPFVSGMAAAKDVRSGAYGKSGIYKMAQDPETYRREIYRLQQEGLPQDEADKRLKIINTAAEIAKQLPVKKSIDPKKNPELAQLNNQWKENIRQIGERTDISEEEKEKLKVAEDDRSAKEIGDFIKKQNEINNVALDYPDRTNYLLHRLNEVLLDEQINNTKDDVIKADLEKQRDRSKKIREGIFNGEIIVGNNLEEIATNPTVAENLGIQSIEDVDEDTLPNNISKPQTSEDENTNGSAAERQQAGEASEGGQNIGQQESTGEQALQQNQEQVEKTVTPGAEGGTTLPPGMTEEQLKKLPKKIQDKILAQQQQKQQAQAQAKSPAPVEDQPASELSDEFNDKEKTAINSIRAKDLSGTGLAQYAAVVNNPESTPQQVKEALQGISNQLNAGGTAEATGSALGGKLSDMIYDLDYPVIDDSALIKEAAKDRVSVADLTPEQLPVKKRELEQALKIPGLTEDEVNDINNELSQVNERLNPPAPTPAAPAPAQQQQQRQAADVYYEPIANVSTDTKRFQPRGTEFSQDSVNKIIDSYDDNKLDPVVLYNDPNTGQQYVLAGHSRLEAHRQLTEMPDSDPRKQAAIENGFQPGNIKARTFVGNEQQAIEFADRSNDLGTRNKDYESANSLRKAREDGQTKKAIQERAKTDFGKNWRYLYNMSYMNPNGKAMQTLKQFESNPDKNVQNQIEKSIQWIGAVRERLGGSITDGHENEMFDYLMDKTRSTKLERENDFINLIQNITGRFDYNPSEPLNLNRIKNKSQAEVNYDTEEAEIKNAIKEKQSEVDSLNDRLNNPQNPAYVNPNAPDYKDVQRIADQKKTNLTNELTALRKELLEHQQNKGKVISSGMAQPGLFDVNNLTPAEQTELNTDLQPDGISLDEISNYENSESISDTGIVPEENRDNTETAGALPQAVQQSPNDQGASAQQNPGSTAVQGQERTGSALTTMDGTLPNKNGVFQDKDLQHYTLEDKRKNWKGVPRAAVGYTQLNNGNWISSFEYHIDNGGTARPATINNTQFPTKQGAVLDALANIENGIKDKKGNSDYQKWIDDTRKSVIAEDTTSPGTTVSDNVKALANELAARLGTGPVALKYDNAKEWINFNDLGLSEADTKDELMDKLIAYDGPFSDFFRAVKNDGNYNNLKIELRKREDAPNNESGLYHPVGYGQGMDGVLQVFDKDNVYYTFAHELNHFLTLDGAAVDSIKDTPAYQAVEDYYTYIVSKKSLPLFGMADKTNYGLTNVKEFMAEILINPYFRENLSDLYANNFDEIAKQSKAIRDLKGGNLGQVIFDFFRELFGKLLGTKAGPSSLDAGYDAQQSIVDNAARLIKDLYFSEAPLQQTGRVIRMDEQQQIRTAALESLALPSLADKNVTNIVRDFVDEKKKQGHSDADIKQALELNGITPEDADNFVNGSGPSLQGKDLALEQKQQRLADAKAAFKASLRKQRGQANSFLVPIDPEVITNGVKLMAAYADLGMYKFKEIIADIAESFGAEFLDKPNVDALKGSYSYYRSNVPREQRGVLNTEDEVDDFIANDLQAYTSPVNDQTEEEFLQSAINEAENEGDQEGADMYRQDLELLNSNPYQYWKDKYESYDTDLTNERRQEAYDNMQKNNPNGASTTSDLAADSTRGTTTNTVTKPIIPAKGTRDITEFGEDGSDVISNVQPQGSPSLFPFDAPTVRTPSDNELPIEERNEQPATSVTRNPDDGRGNPIDEAGISPQSGGNESIERAAESITGQSISDKIKAQVAAESIPVKTLDIDNIRETLPFLMEGQHMDVYKAEKRFYEDENNEEKLYGKGILFTNGTGTGKTLTGLGIAKRFHKQGKKNILVIVPSDVKAKDWISESQEYMQLPMHQLVDTKDKGKDVNITTYANFRENPYIQNRDWDLVMYDESHKINSNGAGDQTSAESAHNTATSNPTVARQKAKANIKYEERLSAITEKNARAREANEEIDYEAKNQLDEELRQETIRVFKQTKVVFLSATPFAYHPNLTYADGYLFKIRETFQPEGRFYGYNQPNSYNSFYITNFGYRMRYNKLTKPESGVDIDLLERQFTESLKNSGVVSSRKLDVDKDYSRQFLMVDNELGAKIDEGISKMSNYEKYPYLSSHYHKKFTFLYKNQLMEAIKAKWAVDRVSKHLELGRKVVISHTYIENTPSHPFRFSTADIISPNNEDYLNVRRDLETFNAENPEYANIDLSGLKSPIQTIQEAFPGRVVLFNGQESKKDRNAAKKLFNTDGSGKDIIMVQMDAGKEGISLHDVTGKHQRALVNLGLPYKPTDAIQIEGRIYRTGQKSDAVIEYPVLHLNFEKFAYANKINERVRTAENLALGEEARNMETAFKEGYINATDELPSMEQGKGGKQEDSRMDGTTEFQKSLTYYYKRGKRSTRDKQNVTGDYYATPEPLGMKMVEWSDLVPNERALEPSAGHGAIARFFSRATNNLFIEPNSDLRSEVSLNAPGETKAGTFEDLNIINKYDGIVMNPPFGRGGKLAMEHLLKAMGHLHDGGRIVALVPTGNMNNRIADWLDSDASKGFYITAKVQLPTSVFERAGTSVSTQILVIDKQLNPDAAANLPMQRNIDLTGYNNIKDFFNAIEDLTLPKRISPGKYAIEPASEPVEAGNSNTPNIPGVSDLAEVVKNFHEKQQRDNWVVKLKLKVDESEFGQMRDLAKGMGGYYSSFKGKGAVPGFQFDNEEKANEFYSMITGEGIPEPEKMSLADRIRTWKISKTGQQLYSTIIPGGPQIWNAAVEIAATSIEAGEALLDALAKAKNYIEQNWKKNWQKAKFGKEMLMELKGRGVLSYDLSDDQRLEADAAIGRIQRTGKLIKEISDLRAAFDAAKAQLTDPQDIQELEDGYTEFERYIFDGLSAQQIENNESFSLDLENQTWWQKQKENWQNKYQRLEQVQKEIEDAGITIDEKNDMVNRADRWKAIAAAKIDNILREVGLSDVDIFIWKGRQKLENSLFDRMAKDGVDYRKFNLYMYAKHAEERNAHNAKVRRENFAKKMAQIEIDLQKAKDEYLITPLPAMKGVITKKENELAAYQEYEKAYNDPTTNKNYIKLLEKKIDYKFRLMDDGGSGMTNQQAEEILEEVQNEGVQDKFEQYENLIRDKVINHNLDLQKEYGLIDKENYEYMKNYYQNYIPLKVDDSFFENGTAYSATDIPGARIYKSKGASNYTFENRNNPLTQSIIDLQATIYEGEQNAYKKVISETIKSAPDSNVWALRSALYAPVKDKAGKVVGLDEIDVPPNGIPYYDDGQKKYLVINDKALYEALTGANVKSAIPILAKINGIFRSLWTVYSPAFTVTNLVRDMETAGIVLSATEKGEIAKNFRGNVAKVFSIIKGSFKQQGGSEKTYWEQRAKEYKDAGGQMTWFQQGTTENMIEDIEEAYKKYQSSGAFEAGKNLGVKLADFVNRANTAVENSTRLAIYDAMLKAGVPQHKAVETARNATINFNKKGNYGAMADSLYLFYNASVQGTTNVLKTMLTTRAGLKMAGGIVLAGMLTSLYNNMMSECDNPDSSANCYDNIPNYEKERNIILKVPGGKGFIKIPLAWGFNVFFNAGEQIGQAINGKTDLTSAASFIASTAFNSFNPTGSVDQPLLQHISPTATDPIVQWFTNKDAFGRPIYNDYEYDRRPDSQKGAKSDSQNAKDLAAWMNRETGGNEKIKGKIDVTPGTLDWLFETFTGGLGQFMSQSIQSTRSAIDPKEDVDIKQVPVVNRFYTVPKERSDRAFIFEKMDDSYNSILSPETMDRFNKEMDKAVRLGEIAPDKAKTYQRTVTRNQYELNNQELFNFIDRTKTELVEPDEIKAFVEELNNRAESGEMPKEWIKSYKAEITKNQNKLKD